MKSSEETPPKLKLEQIVEIPLSSPDYPKSLKQLAIKPARLYCKGNIKLLQQIDRNISIVGTRRASIYGKTCTEMLVHALSNYEANIVSGMAFGIDSAAHYAALSLALPTIAVLGAGLLTTDLCSNPLYHKILEQDGLLVSEYEPYYPAQKWTFRDRNRIISALSFATVVVEAPCNSGALITVEYSRLLNRSIYAMTGDITKPNLVGNLNLINGELAQPIFSSKLWANSLKLNPRGTNKTFSTTPSLSSEILEFIGPEPISLDRLLQVSNRNIGELSSELSKLVSKGYIRKIFGQQYIRSELN